MRRFTSPILIAVLMLSTMATFAGENRKLTREEYIRLYREDAIREMQKSGVPASITLAQACLESSDGNSPLAREANNHFGIKCSNWNGPGYHQDDDAPNECFRKYNSVFESFDDHSQFLKTRPRYANLFQLDPTDYKGWAHGLKKAGYATDPSYAHRLIKIIEEYELHQYDLMEDPNILTASSAPVLPAVAPPKPQSKIYVPATDAVSLSAKRRILKLNGIEYILARKGDTFKSLSEEFHLGYWQLPKYNEMKFGAPLEEGQIVFLQPKKKEAAKRFYTVKEGDSIHSISQQLGVKSKYIIKYNNLAEGQPLAAGSKLVVKD